MILIVHLLFGAAIGSVIKNMSGYPLGPIVLAFLSHYFLDLFPHVEYNIENIEKKQWKNAIPQFTRALLDFCSGILLILIFSNNQPIIYICALSAIVPDGLSILNSMFKSRALQTHDNFHHGKIHFLKYKKISKFWRIASQIAVVFASIVLLRGI